MTGRTNSIDYKGLVALQIFCSILCVSYLRKLCKVNNCMLRMRGHVSAGFLRCDILFLQGKRNGFRHIVASA